MFIVGLIIFAASLFYLGRLSGWKSAYITGYYVGRDDLENEIREENDLTDFIAEQD